MREQSINEIRVCEAEQREIHIANTLGHYFEDTNDDEYAQTVFFAVGRKFPTNQTIPSS